MIFISASMPCWLAQALEKMIKRSLVLFLGAGFSKGFADKPVVKELLEAILKEIPENEEKDLIIKTIKRIFPSLSDPNKADFETLLGIIASLKKNKIDSDKILGNIDAEHVWQVLISYLGQVLHFSLILSTILCKFDIAVNWDAPSRPHLPSSSTPFLAI
ncbi:MAG: hypothetical protein AB1632_13425 [Nitrospirota bacterium]